jgi:proteasome lid subunit RPN8/RPN11
VKSSIPPTQLSERPWIAADGPWPQPLWMPAAARAAVERAAAATHPHEACGLLVGTADAGGVRVVRAEQAANVEAERAHDRFTLAPEDWLRIEDAARGEGLDVVGIWHSHPDHPALPSATDRDAAWEGYAYLIVRVEETGVVDWHAWQLDDARRFHEQEIRFEDPSR